MVLVLAGKFLMAQESKKTSTKLNTLGNDVDCIT